MQILTPSFTRFFAVIGACLITASLVAVGESSPASADPDPCATLSEDPESWTALPSNPSEWADNPRPISNRAELLYLSKMANTTENIVLGDGQTLFDNQVRASYLNADYFLTDDINLGGCAWTPIGARQSSGSPANSTPNNQFFTGTFDGAGHTISGLSVTGSSGTFQNGLGLFGLVSGGQFSNATEVTAAGTIKNLTLEGAVTLNWTSGTRPLGSLAGQIENGRVENVHSRVIVTMKADCKDFPSPIGGLVGLLNGSTISRSSAAGTVSVEQTDDSCVGPILGGLVGILQPSSANPARVEFSSASGNVDGAAGVAVGGLIGQMRQSDKSSEVVDSYYISGTVSGGSVAAGLIGDVQLDGPSKGSVERTYAAAEVLGSSSPAGLINTSAGGPVLNSFWDQDLSGLTASAGGTGKTTEQMRDIETFSSADWDIIEGWETFDPDNDLVWGICSGLNDGYPYLLWQFTFEEAVAAQCAEDPNAASPPGAAPTSGPDRRASAPAIHLDVQVSVGEAISGAPVVIGGEGLAGGSDYSLVVRSTPQVVESGKASSLGNFSKRIAMPAVAPGSHTLTLTAVAPDGSSLILVQGFTVGANGTVTALGSPIGSSGSVLAATGSDQLVMLWSVGLAMLLMVAGLSALAASRVSKAAITR